jgi:hypothetical protein
MPSQKYVVIVENDPADLRLAADIVRSLGASVLDAYDSPTPARSLLEKCLAGE